MGGPCEEFVEGLKVEEFHLSLAAQILPLALIAAAAQQWFIIIGLFVVIRVITSISRNHPAAEPFLQPIVALYGIFAVLTWLGSPLFQLAAVISRQIRTLRFSPISEKRLWPWARCWRRPSCWASPP